MPDSVYIKFPGIGGTSEKPQRADWIEVLTFMLEPAKDSGPEGPGNAHITKHVDEATPPLMRALNSRQRFGAVVIEFERPAVSGRLEVYATITLDDVAIERRDAKPLNPVVETFSLSFARRRTKHGRSSENDSGSATGTGDSQAAPSEPKASGHEPATTGGFRPFDSFARRLDKAWKKTPAAQPSTAPAPPSAAAAPTPFDSYVGRLDKALKQTETAAEAAPSGLVEEGPPASAAPAGAGERKVKQGECISSIAKETGHFWETIWNDPANADLRTARQDPNVLLPGDRVHVPQLREKWSPGQTEMRHRFRRRGWPEMLRFRVLRDDEPRGNQPYTLQIDGRETSGTTDANGYLAQPIEPDARKAVLIVGTPPDADRYEFTLGAIDPVEALSGVQGRLKNLGFDCGPIDAIWGPRSEAALRQYQMSRGLQATGRPDDATRRKLKQDYGS